MDLLALRTQTFEAATQKQGTHCPCCDRFIKVYRRALSSSMAQWLIYMYKRSALAKIPLWLHVEKDFHGISTPSRGDYAKLRYWGLIEAMPEVGGSRGRTNGYWRITKKGEEFVEGRITVPARIHLLDNRVVGWSPKTVTIQDVLGKKFDYNELMAS